MKMRVIGAALRSVDTRYTDKTVRSFGLKFEEG